MDEVFRVSAGIRVSGTVAGPERFVVAGHLAVGSLRARSILVHAGGSFTGLARVEEADIAGVVDGSLDIDGPLMLRATGRVVGVLRCRSLVVEPGGKIDALLRTAGHLPFPPPLYQIEAAMARQLQAS